VAKSLTDNNSKLFFWAKFFGSFSFIAPVVTLFMLHRGLNYSDLLINLIFLVVAMFIFEVPTGMFADRFGPKASFIAGQLAFTISLTILIFANNPLIFYLSWTIVGLGITFFSGADESFIYESLKESKKEKQMSKVWAKITSATFIPAIVGIIIGSILGKDLIEKQFVFLILLTIISSAIPMFIFIFLKNPKVHIKSKEVGMFKHLNQGFKTIKSSPSLLFVFFHEILIFIPTYVFTEYSQPLFVELGISVPTIGIILAVFSLVSFLLLRNLSRIIDKIRGIKLIYICDFIIFLGFAGLIFFTNSIIISLLAFYSIKLLGLIRSPIFSQIKNDHIPSGSRSTTLSLLSVIDSAFDVIILLSLGLIADVGLNVIFIGCLFLVLIGLLFPVRTKGKLS